MKALLTFLITVGTISFATAQNFVPKELFNPDLNLIQKDSPELQLPGYKPANPFLNDTVFSFMLPEPERPVKKNDNQIIQKNNQPQFRMPVFSSQLNSNMPVMIPDSNINYALKIKKIPSFNPLEMREDSVIIEHRFKK